MCFVSWCVFETGTVISLSVCIRIHLSNPIPIKVGKAGFYLHLLLPRLFLLLFLLESRGSPSSSAVVVVLGIVFVVVAAHTCIVI